ncbi:ABC transporter ATP-binding protein [Curtobacterium sp. KT1]|uniref:ABC transporter ATP-binding protein n=1 Tax=Curtobacterium sp. KT1 TaxID=3372858 RepID=UPI0037C099E7
MPKPELALCARSCTKQYAGDVGISGVDLQVDPGELAALLGPNGSGKSTFIHGLVGLHGFDAGTVTIAGHPHESVHAKQCLGFVPDELPIPLSLTGNEFLRHTARLRRGTPSELGVEMVDALGLEPHLYKFIADMSHGTKKKLQLVAAAAHAPALLIMDEPFRGLDPHAVRTIRAIVDALRSTGTAVLVATHDILAAEHWFDRVVILHEGTRIADGPPQDIIARGGARDLEDFFLSATRMSVQDRSPDRFRSVIVSERNRTA